jgi:enoyl-CoA hydratase
MAPRKPEGDWLGTPYLTFERRGPFAWCTVDRPQRRNALTFAMYFGIRYASNRVDSDPDLAALILTGTGDVFIPGGDFGGGADDDWAGGVLGMECLPFDTMRQSVKPVVTAVNGLCQGGGLMISMLCDCAVASDRATFRAPELYRGISDTHYAQILARQIGPGRARDMLLTARTLSASEALDWGLITRVVPHGSLHEAAVEIATACARSAPNARLDIKRSLDQYYGLYDRIGMAASLRSAEAVEGFTAFAERRAPAWIHPDLRPEGRL